MNVLVTGGLGCLGSAAARRFVQRGDSVRVLDNRLARHGANDRNLLPVRDRVNLIEAAVGDVDAVRGAVAGVDVVVHAAAHVSHTAGIENVELDLEHNVRGTLVVLDSIRNASVRPRFVFLSTRGVYGAPRHIPVDEEHECGPLGPHEWSKLAAEEAIRMHARLHGLDYVILRITNAYGPGGQIRVPEFGVINWWIGRALRGDSVPVYGTGDVRRDLLYVDDVAEAIVSASISSEAAGRTINIGSTETYSLREIAEAIVLAAGRGRVEMVPYSAARRSMEVGDFATNPRLAAELLEWQPRTPLPTGLDAAIQYYRAHWEAYA